MKHFILLILFGFFIAINADVKVEEKQTLNEYKIEQQQKRYFYLRSGAYQYHLQIGEDEPCHPWHFF